MRKVFYIFCLLSIVLPLYAQMPPDWYNVSSRKMHYPSETYYTGYVSGIRHGGETIDDAMSRLKNEARVELASSIRTTVEHSMQNTAMSDLQQSSTDFNEDIREIHISDTRISSSIKDIPGLNVEVWQNPKDGEIAAFAYVKRMTLINQLTKRIAMELGKVESSYEMSQQMLDDGQKTQAKKYAQSGLDKLGNIEEAQNLLAAVDETADEEMLQLEQTKALKSSLNQLVMQLRNALGIYIQCDAKLFSGSYSALSGAICGELSKMGVTFVSSADQADWSITIYGAAREHKKVDFGSSVHYAAWADIDIAIEHVFTHKQVYSNRFSELGNHTFGFDDAARDAYIKVTPVVIEAIKEQIQQ